MSTIVRRRHNKSVSNGGSLFQLMVRGQVYDEPVRTVMVYKGWRGTSVAIFFPGS